MSVNVASWAVIAKDLDQLVNLIRQPEFRDMSGVVSGFSGKCDAILHTVDHYVGPRLSDPGAPVVAAIVGPAGVGKSTIFNAVAGSNIAAVGALRPTTVVPLIWASSAVADVDSLAIGMADRFGDEVTVEEPSHPLGDHVWLIDTPPLGYHDASGVAVAEEVASFADLCIVVVSSGRYADAIVWDFMTRIQRQGTPTVFVVNRVPEDEGQRAELLGDFARRLSDCRLLGAPDPDLLFTVPTDEVGKEAGRLEAAAALQEALGELVDPAFRSVLRYEMMLVTVRAVIEGVRDVVRSLTSGAAELDGLADSVTEEYRGAGGELADEIVNGGLQGLGRLDGWEAAAKALTARVSHQAGVAADAVATTWSAVKAAADVLGAVGNELERGRHEHEIEIRRRIDSWHASLDTTYALFAKGSWWPWRSTAAVIDAVWRSAVDADVALTSQARRRFGDQGPQMVRAARGALTEVVRSSLRSEAERFKALLAAGDSPSLYSQVVARADSIEAELNRQTHSESDGTVGDVGDLAGDAGEDVGTPVADPIEDEPAVGDGEESEESSLAAMSDYDKSSE